MAIKFLPQIITTEVQPKGQITQKKLKTQIHNYLSGKHLKNFQESTPF